MSRLTIREFAEVLVSLEYAINDIVELARQDGLSVVVKAEAIPLSPVHRLHLSIEWVNGVSNAELSANAASDFS